nr:alkene reductase [Burkholderiaceae bacterium]
MSTKPLFQPLQVGPCTLAHRVVMAPLTRMRATVPGHIANALNAQYYAQRASAGGLIIAEASQVMPGGGSANTPGIHTPEQVEGWKGIAQAIHAKGGFVFLQLWHMGRISHSSNQPGGAPPIAPSAIAATGMTMSATGARAPFDTPRALRTDEIPGIIEAYAQAARNAMAAGFDGVEVHAANGYLLEQFMQSASNQRT